MVRKNIGDGREERWTVRTFVLHCKLIVVRLIESVDLCRCELASRHSFGEKDVELVEGAVFGLGKAEIGPDEDEPGAAAPNEAGVSYMIM